MRLKDLHQLAQESKEKYSSIFINSDIKLHKEFKDRFTQVLNEREYSVEFLEYSAKITTSSGNDIFLPNQWFYIATFMVDYYLELVKYKQELEKILAFVDLSRDKKSVIKALKENNYEEIEEILKEALEVYFEQDADNINFMWKFLTQYDWWHGQKTIDRTDFHVSPILNLLGVVNVSQNYIADIVEILASNNDLRKEAELLINQLEELTESFIEDDKKESIDIPKNLILYGPPGTGKTFKTVEIALKICGYWTEEMNTDRRKAVEMFRKLQCEERIEFITFHQSMSYEEFIEGLSAQVENGEVVYKIKDGIFKNICKKASQNIFNRGDIIGRYEITRVEKGLVCVKNSEGAVSPIPFDLIEDIAKNILANKCTLEDVKKGSNKHNVSTLYDNYILGYKSILHALVEHYLNNMEKTQNDKNYVLIIDEINRANISKVFGDLITLIEEDKRKGAENEIKVRLPYSQEYFTVPSNVYIVGTMNTADRSIALMDVALRRRFEFEEIMPQTQMLGSVIWREDEIKLDELLDVINKRITVILERNYTLGQSIFINVTNINQLVLAIKNKLIPLLQEYFYEDWNKIALVLGDNQKSDSSLRLIIKSPDYKIEELFGENAVEYEDQSVYTVNPEFGKDEEKDFKIIKSIYAPRGLN